MRLRVRLCRSDWARGASAPQLFGDEMDKEHWERQMYLQAQMLYGKMFNDNHLKEPSLCVNLPQLMTDYDRKWLESCGICLTK